uniref:Uncharacterized protein n=1 Tax=Parascaris equorum TaxID=6256 RepID=A0A914SHZ6_PAREQ
MKDVSLYTVVISPVTGFHPSVHDLSGASSSAQHSSSTPDNHPLVLGGAPPLTAGGTQASSAGGQRLDSTPHSVETPNQLLNTQQTSVDNISDAGRSLFSHIFSPHNVVVQI